MVDDRQAGRNSQGASSGTVGERQVITFATTPTAMKLTTMAAANPRTCIERSGHPPMYRVTAK